MFEVYRIETERIYTVYQIKETPSDKYVEDDLLFLIYSDKEWVWVSAYLYAPVIKDDKHMPINKKDN